MKKTIFKNIFCITTAICFAFSCFFIPNANAAQTKSLDSQREEIERKLIATEKKLAELGEESKDTQEYIDTLDEKLVYLNQQYSLAKEEAEETENKVKTLENNILENESEIENISLEISKLENKSTVLNEQFESTYDAYCNRIRALYISGNQSSTLSFLLTSNGISNLFTRLEMISAVSKQDGELLQSVKNQTSEIVELTDKLNNKKEELAASQTKLKTNKQNLEEQSAELSEKQKNMEKQQENIETQQQEANTLLQELHNKTKEYGEFRDITREELDEIDAAIEEADKKYPISTTKKATTSTTEKATKKAESSNSSSQKTTQNKTTTAKKATTSTTKKTTSKYINLTYPCPKYTTITCGFGAYSGHTGCDFSTSGNVNQKVVAAEDGTVIISTDLKNSDGSYRSYGRYIVIRHDKTTSSGKTVYTLYAHNNSRLVSEGDHITKGQQIAKSGSTGNSTGPHVHFEVRVGGSSQRYAVNPANYLP